MRGPVSFAWDHDSLGDQRPQTSGRLKAPSAASKESQRECSDHCAHGEKNLIVRTLHQTLHNSSTPSSDLRKCIQVGYPQSRTTKELVRELSRELDQEEVNDETICLEV